jgi:hypothetical protein
VPPDSDQTAEVILGCEESQVCGFAAVYGGTSADAQHVIFQADDALTPGAVAGTVNLYEWSAGRPLELISPPGVGGGGFGSATQGAASLVDEAGDGGAANGFPYNFSRALSSDGRRAFWTGGGNQIYMHEIVGSGSRTVTVSASQKSGEPSTSPAQYWTANSDGSLVYFTSAGQLTADATATAGGQDLYQYNTNSGVLSDLSVDPQAGETAAVKGVLGAGESEGVPYVYFTAAGVLASNENSQGEKAVPQTCQSPTYTEKTNPRTPCNLYVSHGGQTTFIATLGEAEDELSDFTEAVMARTSRVSPNGRFLAFQSELPLTGYDNTPANGQPCPQPEREGVKKPYGSRCLEVFEYDAQSGRLVCASCDRSGLPPTGDSMVPETLHGGENVLGWSTSTVQQRYLLDDGRLFFQSENALLPQATNSRSNIYEYEPEGTGQCVVSGGDGCVYLISTGGGSGDSYFADASADGRDVFFLTGERLVPQDGDEALDMYDAREDGGFSAVQPPPCGGEACKPAVTPAPAIYGAPASAAFQGAGNIPAAPAVKLAGTAKKVEKTPKKRGTKGKARRKRGKTGRRSGKRLVVRKSTARRSGKPRGSGRRGR